MANFAPHLAYDALEDLATLSVVRRKNTFTSVGFLSLISLLTSKPFSLRASRDQ
jgi:hypothetical protein